MKWLLIGLLPLVVVVAVIIIIMVRAEKKTAFIRKKEAEQKEAELLCTIEQYYRPPRAPWEHLDRHTPSFRA